MVELKFWIIQTGEPIPGDTGDERPMRAWNLAEELVARGHSVVVWTSSFFHQRKEFRPSTGSTRLSETLTIHYLPSCGYVRNVGISRLRDHWQLAKNFRRRVEDLDKPDAIFVGYPPIELAREAVCWGRKNGVPTILDVKDQWPDYFLTAVPRLARPFFKLLLRPYFRFATETMAAATLRTANSRHMLNWAQKDIKSEGSVNDAVFPLATRNTVLDSIERSLANEFWREKGVQQDGSLRAVFVGSLSPAFDFEPIRQAATVTKWQFVVCGDGSERDSLIKQFADLDNVIFPGWISRSQATILYERATVGMAPYRPEFAEGLTNKFFDYLNSSLPIMSSLQGEVATFLEENAIGFTYSASDSPSLTSMLERIEQDQRILEQIRRNFGSEHLKQFTGQHVYRNLADTLEQLVEQQRR